MDYITEKFAKLGVDSAPGQELRQKVDNLKMIGEKKKSREFRWIFLTVM